MKAGNKTKGIVGLFRSSFSLRLSLYILLITTFIFVITLVVTYRTASRHVQNEVVDHAQASLDNTILQINTILQDVETAVESISPMIGEMVQNADAMYDITHQLLTNNPGIVGSAIAFAPNFYTDKGEYFAPYSYRQGEEIACKQLGSESYDYHNMEWYSVPYESCAPYWSEPYYDIDGAEAFLATYSYPIRNDSGEIYAIFTADISIEQFAEQVRAIKPFPDVYNFMLSRQGAFLAHSRFEAIFTETIFENAIRFNEPQLIDIANRMIAMERGVCVYERNDTEYYVLYAPVANTGWSIAVACRYIDIFGGVYSLRDTIIAIFVIGAVLIVLLCHITIRRLTRPLKRLTAAAANIATGNFDNNTPRVSGRDEMRQLRDAFEEMRLSLINYIDELRSTTAQKERMASELRVARDIQLGMLPKDTSIAQHVASIELASHLVAAKEVGGDLYNYFVKDGKLYFIIGDVSGKGVPAAMLMAVICRMFRTVASAQASPADIMVLLNRVLAENNERNMFCTAFVGVLDIEEGTLNYANAGHNPPIIFGNDIEPQTLNIETNIALGVIDDFDFVGGQYHLNQGSHILLYTDGITEAQNACGKLYGEERLLEFLAHRHEQQPCNVVNALFEEIGNYGQGCEQSDDIAILDIKLTYNKDE